MIQNMSFQEKKYKLEIIGFTIEGCLTAEFSGANRVELCDNPLEGGTTPSIGFIKTARKQLKIGIHPMIRPRGGDFIYSNLEFSIMLDDIRMCKNAGCEGIVTGLLSSDGTVDKKRLQHICDLAYPLDVTFHRAFDRTADPFTSLEDIIDAGCDRILTSGQASSAVQGAPLIKEIIGKANDRIIIMPGAGINSTNIKELALTTEATEFHASARKCKESIMEFFPPGMGGELKCITVDGEEVKMMIKALGSIPHENGPRPF